MMRIIFCCLIFAVCSVFVGCSTSPEGRQQLSLIPDAQMDQMGAQSFSEIKKETPRSKDQRKVRYVNCVTSLLLKQLSEVDEGKWEVVVFESKDINAFALPGRKIGVYTGIMEVANTPGQLAAVLGHEVGHVIANHGNERVSTALVAQGGLTLASAAMDSNNKNHGLLMAALGVGAQYGVLLPHGRNQESESDMIGITLMAKAGFDPRESVRLWENMAAKSGGGGPEWLSTHPSSSTRIKQLQQRMDSAMTTYADSQYREQAASCRL